jgi:hypothetical protein
MELNMKFMFVFVSQAPDFFLSMNLSHVDRLFFGIAVEIAQPKHGIGVLYHAILLLAVVVSGKASA